MNDVASHATGDAEARSLVRTLAPYREQNTGRAAVELAITAVPLVLLWIVTWAVLPLGYWASLLFAVPAAGFLVRLFMIQHDCGHGSFFRQRSANDWTGRALSSRLRCVAGRTSRGRSRAG